MPSVGGEIGLCETPYLRGESDLQVSACGQGRIQDGLNCGVQRSTLNTQVARRERSVWALVVTERAMEQEISMQMLTCWIRAG